MKALTLTIVKLSRAEREKPLGAQGIAAESPQESHRRFPRTWSGKPGFLRLCRKKCAIMSEKK
jgi:hypothetical protein